MATGVTDRQREAVARNGAQPANAEQNRCGASASAYGSATGNTPPAASSDLTAGASRTPCR